MNEPVCHYDEDGHMHPCLGGLSCSCKDVTTNVRAGWTPVGYMDEDGVDHG